MNTWYQISVETHVRWLLETKFQQLPICDIILSVSTFHCILLNALEGNIFHMDADYGEMLKCSRLCVIVFTSRLENSIYGTAVHKLSLYYLENNYLLAILGWFYFEFPLCYTIPSGRTDYVFAADSVFELDSSTESAEASPEVNHRVRRSGVMARRGTPSR